MSNLIEERIKIKSSGTFIIVRQKTYKDGFRKCDEAFQGEKIECEPL